VGALQTHGWAAMPAVQPATLVGGPVHGGRHPGLAAPEPPAASHLDRPAGRHRRLRHAACAGTAVDLGAADRGAAHGLAAPGHAGAVRQRSRRPAAAASPGRRAGNRTGDGADGHAGAGAQRTWRWTRHCHTRTDPRREVLALGVANVASVSAGGLPLLLLRPRALHMLEMGGRTRAGCSFAAPCLPCWAWWP
jgi:hypothetical protein